LATEDELAKKTITDAIWVWSGRILTLLVVFGAGWFTGWVMYGSGVTGAPALRTKVPQLEATITDLKNQRVDIDGRLTVAEGRLQQCNKSLQEARTAAAAAPAGGAR
jgi:hypothetical protein